MVSELYEILDRKDSAANYLVKLAEQISRNNWLAAMFLERAAFKYLQLGMHRKFAFFTAQAAMNYNVANRSDYAINCY